MHQYARPILIDAAGHSASLDSLSREVAASGGGYSEAYIQNLIFAHPETLPINEIDRSFDGGVPICTELNTPVGPIDALLVNALGLPTLVECKLWRNPEARREVVGQILDYAKELGRWSYTDFQREVSRRLGRPGNAIFEIVREQYPDLDEAQFADDLSSNLRKGRFLLLIVGDGIRESVEVLAEYLQRHAGLHFTFGLVEMPLFALPNGSRLALPRVLAKTTIVGRTIVELPDIAVVRDEASGSVAGDSVAIDSANAARGELRKAFWAQFLSGLQLDDPEQPVPSPSTIGQLSFMMPISGGVSWITVYRDTTARSVGLFLSYSRDSLGEVVLRRLLEDWETLRREIGGSAEVWTSHQRTRFGESMKIDDLDDPISREPGLAWLRERINRYINVLRPRIRSLVAEIAGDNR